MNLMEKKVYVNVMERVVGVIHNESQPVFVIISIMASNVCCLQPITKALFLINLFSP